jgi:hypothetical protein
MASGEAPHAHLATLSDDALIAMLLNNDSGSGPYEKAKLLLEYRNARVLARFTRGLVVATWALVCLTAALAPGGCHGARSTDMLSAAFVRGFVHVPIAVRRCVASMRRTKKSARGSL